MIDPNALARARDLLCRGRLHSPALLREAYASGKLAGWRNVGPKTFEIYRMAVTGDELIMEALMALPKIRTYQIMHAARCVPQPSAGPPMTENWTCIQSEPIPVPVRA